MKVGSNIRSISDIKHEAVDKCFRSPVENHMTIMAEMIEKAYQEGRKQGHAEMSAEAKIRMSNLIPDHLEY